MPSGTPPALGPSSEGAPAAVEPGVGPLSPSGGPAVGEGPALASLPPSGEPAAAPSAGTPFSTWPKPLELWTLGWDASPPNACRDVVMIVTCPPSYGCHVLQPCAGYMLAVIVDTTVCVLTHVFLQERCQREPPHPSHTGPSPRVPALKRPRQAPRLSLRAHSRRPRLPSLWGYPQGYPQGFLPLFCRRLKGRHLPPRSPSPRSGQPRPCRLESSSSLPWSRPRVPHSSPVPRSPLQRSLHSRLKARSPSDPRPSRAPVPLRPHSRRPYFQLRSRRLRGRHQQSPSVSLRRRQFCLPSSLHRFC